VNTNFSEAHAGITVGAGTYLLPRHYDPVPSAGGTDAQLSGSEKVHFIPAKLGVFTDLGSAATLEAYARYLFATRAKWTVESSAATGSGSSEFSGYGAGLVVGLPFYRTPRFRALFVGRYELQFADARLVFQDNSQLDLSATRNILGAGLQAEAWLGDLYSLSALAGFDYGLGGNWQVKKASRFLGQDYTAGNLRNSHGETVSGQLMALYLELGFKLSFY